MNHLTTLKTIAARQIKALRARLPHRSFALFEAAQVKRMCKCTGKYAARISVFILAFGLAGVLAGCSSLRVVDSQVTAFSKLNALPAASTWRFERLPSQQNLDQPAAARQSKLELMAAQELAKHGFSATPLTDGLAQYSVQIQARTQRVENNSFDSFAPWGMQGPDYMLTRSGQLIYLPVWPRYTPPWFIREVSILIRDTSDNRIVYETRAKHDGYWPDDEAVLPAMFAAALQGFPNPPEGRRKVDVDIPR